MAAGPGKYDELATRAREDAGAQLVAVIVIGGSKGSGFSIQTTLPWLVARLPQMLRDMADQIERGEG